MSEKEKQLLLIDLCARLTYGIRVKIGDFSDYTLICINTINDSRPFIVKYENYSFSCSIDIVKPYFRPMSSMTEEEIKTYRTLQDIACSYHYEFGDIVDDFLYFDNDASLDYLNSIHIDHRGLIPMGLALEAPEDMYKF